MRPLLGISLKVLSALAFTLMSAAIRHMSTRYPTGELVFFRSAFALVPLIVWLAARGEFPSAVRTSNVIGHFKRGLIGGCGMFCGFLALTYLPLSEAVAIGYASPLFVVVFAAFLLGETVRVHRWCAVLVGLVGVLIMLSPRLSFGLSGTPSAMTLGAMFGLMGALCSAGATVQVRRLTHRETTGAIVFYFSILTTMFGLATALLGWVMPTWQDAGILIGAGILGGIGQILMTQSFRYAETSTIAPFEYTTMIWAVLLGWFVFGELPSAAVMVGGCIVASAGIFVIWREHRLGLERRRAAEAAPPRVA